MLTSNKLFDKKVLTQKRRVSMTTVQEKNSTERRSAKYPREDKQAIVAEIKEYIETSKATLFTEYRGLSVSQLAELRAELRAEGSEYKVYKNTLVRLAATSAGYNFDETLTGPIAIAFAKSDAVATAKIIKKHVDSTKILTIKAGLLGDTVLDESEIVALAKLPSREVLLAQVAGAYQAPLSKAARLFQAPITKAAYAIKALAEKKDSEEAA